VTTELGCALGAFGIAAASADRIDGLRQKPGPPLKQRISPVLLKYSDEQAVMGLAAVLEAAHRFGLHETDFTDWGVIAAPCAIGRPKLAGILTRHDQEGVRGVSPMSVPHLSLHSLSGTISQALHSHGINFGVSSGPDHVAEGLLAAAAVVTENALPGLWLVLTGWDSIPVSDEEGRCLASNGTFPICRGVALALQFPGTDPTKPRLRVRTDANRWPVDKPSCTSSVGVHAASAGDLPGLAAFLSGQAGASWSCPLDAAGSIDLTGTIPVTRMETAA
jgi:hypothetical protein